MREVNFLVFVARPSYTDVDVAFAITVFDGWKATDVICECRGGGRVLPVSGNVGTPAFGDQVRPVWLNRRFVRYLEVASVINGVEGVDEVVSLLQLGKNGGALAREDVALDGEVALPRAGGIGGELAT